MMIMNNRLRWLGHVMRMPDERMPKRMMFGKLQTARPAGGTKQRWKDCVQHDLRFMGLEAGWSDLTQQRDKWHSMTREAVTKGEKEKNAKEEADYVQKKAGIGVKCPHCGVPLKNEKGLKSHIGQKHPKWNFYPEDSSSEDSDDDEDDDEPSKSSATTTTTKSKPRTSAPSSSSSSSSTCSSSSKYVCPECLQDCSSGAGLASHRRHTGHAAASAPTHVKKKER